MTDPAERAGEIAFGAAGLFVGGGEVALLSQASKAPRAYRLSDTIGSWGELGVSLRSREVADTPMRSLGGLPEGLNPVPASKLELWQNYLSKRGVKFEIGTERAYAKLAENDAVGLFEQSNYNWELNQYERTIYLPENPNASVFYEEGLHALDSLKGRPRTMEFGGRPIDAWEYRAKSTLLNAAPKRFTYEEFRVLEQHLELVKQGRY